MRCLIERYQIKTFCVPTVLSCDTRGRHNLFSQPVYSARLTFGGFCKKSAYCNRLDDVTFQNQVMRMKGATPCIPRIGPPVETGRCTKQRVREAVP